MAAKNQFLAQGLNKELTCAVCISRLFHPKVLPCLHTYCRECLVKLVEKSRNKENISVTCPKCRETHPLPANGIDGFRTHFTLNNLLELLDIHDKTSGCNVPGILCESGVDEKPAVARCLTCEVYLCETCRTFHTKQKLSRDHTVLSLEEIKSSGKEKGVQSIRKKRYCAKHKDEVLIMYCKTCQKIICRDCALKQHREHNSAFISEVRQETQKILEKLTMDVAAKDKETVSHGRHVIKMKQSTQDSLRTKEQDIEEAFGNFIAYLNAYKTKLVSKVRETHQTTLEQIEAEISCTAQAHHRLVDSVRFMQQLFENGDDIEVMLMSHQAKAHLENLLKITWDHDKIKSTELCLTTHSRPKQTMSSLMSVYPRLKPDDVTLEVPEDIHALDEFEFKVRLLTDNIKMGSGLGEFNPRVKVVCGENEIAATMVEHKNNTVVLSCAPKETGNHSISITYQVGSEETVLKIKEHTVNVQSPVMRVGRKVVRGPNWSWGNQDGGVGSIGTVIKVIDCDMTSCAVSWNPNNPKSTYQYQWKPGKYEINFVE